MDTIREQIQQRAAQLLSQGQVERFYGWQKGPLWWQSVPICITKPQEAPTLIWDEFCASNLAKYLMDAPGKTGVVLKGCDGRSLVRLIRDKVINRTDVHIIGIPCPGLKDAHQARVLDQDNHAQIPLAKCEECLYPQPLEYDELLELDPKKPGTPVPDPLEDLDCGPRAQFWSQELSKCIRCNACRNICPACNCGQCVFDAQQPNWLDKAVNLSNNQTYHLVRFLHVTGRCVQCGECTRVCPAGIPLNKFVTKINRCVNDLFGPFSAGLDLEEELPLGTFDPQDPDMFE